MPPAGTMAQTVAVKPSALGLRTIKLLLDVPAAALEEIFTAFLLRQGGALALSKALAARVPPKEAAEVGLRVMSASGRR